MTKQEIEKMFSTCNNYHSCALCPYNPEDISLFIGDEWVGGCPNYDRKLVYAMSKGYRKGYRKAEKVRKETAKEILDEIDNALHDLAMFYADIGHKDYGAVCEYVHLKVISKIAQKYDVEVEE